MDQTYMKQKPVLPLVVSMALPMTLSMLVNSLYNIVDSIFIAKISDNAMTALSLVYPIQNLIMAITVGFAIGTNAVISIHLGAGNKKEADRAASLGTLLNAFHGLLLMIVCLTFIRPFLELFTTDQDVISLGIRYARITLSFSIPIGISVSLEKIFQATGRMKVSMVAMMAGCIGNIILDPLMIFGIGPFPAMGIEGAAIATAIGQMLSLVIYLVFCVVRPLPVTFSLSCCKPSKQLLLRLYTVGIPATLNLALPSLRVYTLKGILAAYAQADVLVLCAYYNVQTFLYLTGNGVVQGMRPLIGYNYGAGEHKRVNQLYRLTLIMNVCIMAVGMILCLTIPGKLMGAFAENPETVQVGIMALHIICFGFVVSAVSVTGCGALEGLGKGVPSLLISLSRYVVLIIPLAFIFSRFWGAVGVWHAFWVAEALTAIFAAIIYQRSVRE